MVGEGRPVHMTKVTKSSLSKISILMADSHLHAGNQFRGVGVYTKLLSQALSEHPDVTLVDELNSAQIIHYPHFELYSASLPIRKKKPAVITIHDVIPLVFPEAYKPGFKGTLKFIHQRLALGNVRAILTDSETSAADIARYLHVKPHRIFVVPLAAAADLQTPSGRSLASVKRKYHLPSNYILYVGDINYNKNLPQLIKSLKYLPWQVKLVMVGKNMRDQKISEWQDIQTQIALSDVAKRVMFIPDVPANQPIELAAIYANAICYVQPSLYEGFGLPVLEALQVGTPVVSSHTSSLPEIVGDAGILVEPTAEGLGSAVKQVLEFSGRERQAVIARGKARSRRFSWHRVAEQTMAVYRHALYGQT